MSDFISVAKVDEIANGTMKMVKVGEHEVLLAWVGDSYFAADNRCPHLHGNLSAGTLAGTIVTCPVHHSQFDLSDGHVVRWTDWSGLLLTVGEMVKSPHPLKTYAAKVEGRQIFVNI